MIASMNKNGEIKYPYLPEGRQFHYVSDDNQYMEEAKKISKEYSTDRNHPTGAVVVLNGEIIGRAANQAGYKNKTLIKLHETSICIRKFLKIRSGEKYWLCPGCSTNKNHAETGAVNDALKNLYSDSEKLKEADLYLWGHWWACEPCWKSIIDAGIQNVYLLEGSEILFNKNHKDHKIGQFISVLS